MRVKMFVVMFVGAGVMAAAQGRGQSVADSGAPLVFEIAARQYISADRVGSSAGDSGTDRLEGYAWTGAGLCGMSASTTEPATVPGVGWHFVGRVLSNDGGQMRVSIEWQRMWERGVRTPNGASGSQTIALRNGERVQLDRVLPIGQPGCNVSETRLEAAVVARPVYRVGVMGEATGRMAMAGGRGGRASVSGAGDATGAMAAGAAGGRGRGTAATVDPSMSERRVFGRGTAAASTDPAVAGSKVAQGTTGVASAGGTSVGMGRGGRGGTASTNATDPASATTSNVASATQGSGRGGRASTSAAMGQDQRKIMTFLAVPKSREAELWLVHRTPDGTEHVQQQMVRFGGAETAFTFPSVQVSTSKGTVTLEITGKLQSFVGNEAPPSGSPFTTSYRIRPVPDLNNPSDAQHILVSLSRRARGNTPALLDSMGNSVMVIDVPKPDDVVSFEFPTLQKAAEDLLKGHVFSLRVQIK